MQIFHFPSSSRHKSVAKMASEQETTDAEMIKECEEYVKKHNVQVMLKDAIVQLCINKPENPFRFLQDQSYFLMILMKMILLSFIIAVE